MSSSSNIKTGYSIQPQVRLSMKDYTDFYLHPGHGYNDLIDLQGQDIVRDCLLTNFTLDLTGSTIVSDVKWEDLVITTGLTLNDVGLVGLDNGLINLDKSITGCTYFYSTVTGSTLTIDNSYEYLNLHPVTGYTKDDVLGLRYDINQGVTGSGVTYNDLRGGFYQGFFKLEEYDYQILPLRPETEFSFEFYLNPQPNSVTGYTTINDLHPDNKGIFFYMGTRAENKFFDINPTHTTGLTTTGSPYFTGCTYEPLYTSTGLEVLKHTKDLITDNKFIFFDRTCSGTTISNYDPEARYVHEVSLIKPINDNKFIDWNRSCTGKTICNQSNLPATEHDFIIDPRKDLTDNAFALRTLDDGRVGYRLITKNCEENGDFVIEEEYSTEPWVLPGQWNHVVVRMIFDRELITCGLDRKFKLYFYVNGFLKFVSKELKELDFRGLTADRDKQQTVPYNISVGGGTQGLMEAVYYGYPNDYVQNMNIEKYFCGSFIGGISNFRMYTCQFDYSKVLNNYYYFKNYFA
jgi:hypothetical protein